MKKYRNNYITFSPPMSVCSLMIDIECERVYGNVWGKSELKEYYRPTGQILNNYEEVYQYVKTNDNSGKWLRHHHNLYSTQDGTYLENMFLTIRRRYGKDFKDFYPNPNIII